MNSFLRLCSFLVILQCIPLAGAQEAPAQKKKFRQRLLHPPRLMQIIRLALRM